MFSKKYLDECFLYWPDGELTWKLRPYSHFKEEHVCDIWNAKHCGEPVGIDSVKINNRKYQTVHIIWTLNSGIWPSGSIYRVSGPTNEIYNLKMMEGSKIKKTSVFKQLSWHEPLRQWRLEKRLDGNLVCPIFYGSLEEAAKKYV